MKALPRQVERAAPLVKLSLLDSEASCPGPGGFGRAVEERRLQRGDFG
jgi:hypothetical protein